MMGIITDLDLDGIRQGMFVLEGIRQAGKCLSVSLTKTDSCG